MIRVEVIEQFTLKDYENIKDSIKRKSVDVKGTLFVGDTFECDEDMVKYLTGDNKDKQVVVKVIEVEPKIIPIPNAKPEEVEIIPIPNAKVEDVKIMPVKSSKKKKSNKK